MNIATKVALGVGGSIALASGIYYGTHEATRDVGTLSVTEGLSETPKVVKTKSGKQIRIVTGHAIQSADIESEFGKAKVLDQKDDVGVPGDALCNIVFLADVKTKDGRTAPDLEGIGHLLNAGVEPVLVGMDGDTGIWNCLFKGPDCIEAAEKLDYVGSDIQQLINHKSRDKILHTYAKVGAVNSKGEKKHIVDFDDADADPDAEVFFGHEWYGRPDLNFGRYKAGKLKTAVEVENERKQVK